MEGHSEKLTGTIQYWLEVHRIGSLLFQNIENGDSALKSLITSIIETPLLSDIECLSNDGVDDRVVCPFTCWILQGLLKASIYHTQNGLQEFYVEAQRKLLCFTHESSVFEFSTLVKLYVKALEEVITLKDFNSSLKFFLFDDYPLTEHDRKLTCCHFVIKNKKDQINCAAVLFEIIIRLKHLILYHCQELCATLWNLTSAAFLSDVRELYILVLPLMSEIMNYEEVEIDDTELKRICEKIILMLVDGELIASSSIQEDIINIWNGLKRRISVVSYCDDNFLKKMVNIKDLYTRRNFIYEEFVFLFSQNPCFPFSTSDELHLLFGPLINEATAGLMRSEEFHRRRHGGAPSGEALTFDLKDVSDSWKRISQRFSAKCGDGSVECISDRFNFFSDLLLFCNMCLWKLDKDYELLNYRVVLIFFGGDLGKIIETILIDLKNIPPSGRDAASVGIETLSSLLNLPEAAVLPEDNFKRALDFIVPPLLSNKFELPNNEHSALMNSSIAPSRFLKSLQCIPPGLPAESCLSIFSKSVARSDEPRLNHQAVASVPFLFLTRRVTAADLIRNILSPGLRIDRPALQLLIVDVTCDLVCSLAGTGFVVRNDRGEPTIACSKCSSSKPPKGTSGDDAVVDDNLMTLLSKILSTSTPAKHRLLNNLHRLTMHTNGLRSESFLSKLFTFFEDPDEGVRYHFGRLLTSIIFGRSSVVDSYINSYRSARTSQSKGLDKSEEETDDGAAAAIEQTLRKLEDLIHLSLTSEAHRHLQNSLLETTANIACFPSKRVLSRSIRLLLLFINRANAPLSSIFYEVAVAHRTTQLVLYYSYRPEISQFLGNLIVVNRLLYNQPLRSTLAEVTSIFKGLSESRFAAKSENYIVPIIFEWVIREGELEGLLYEWSDYVGQPLPVVISNTFQNIYTYLLLNETPDIFGKFVAFVERLSDIKISELIAYSQKSIINELLFNYHRCPAKVLTALKNVIRGSSTCSDEGEIMDGLAARFVGYLLFIVSKFVKDVNADSEKIHAIQSLTAVIKLMGKNHVTPVARKVLATLQTTLSFNFNEYYSVHFTALATFVETVDVEQLGPLLTTVITLLIPFLDYEDVDAAKVFTYIIIENKKAVVKFLPNLLFMPNHPKLQKVNKYLERFLKFDEEMLKDRLTRETSLALHETVRVRIEGLNALLKTIKNSYSNIQNLIIGSDEPDPCIKTLLEGMMLCCSDTDPKLSVRAAACLGELGAIDPGLFPRKPKPKNELPLSVHAPEFAYLALTEMTRGLQNARKSVDMDAFAVAIQELLKMYQISPTAENRIWSRFPKQLQGLMKPMLSSRYKVQSSKRNVLPEIIFGSKEASSHITWASLWASKLIGFCKDDRAVILFKVCEPSLKCDVKVLLFFLRYILLHAIIRDSSVHDKVVKEIESVVKWSESGFEFNGIRQKSRPVRLVDYCGCPNMKSTISTSDAQACAMTVFFLLDFLQSWFRIYRDSNLSSHSDQSYKKDFTLVKTFLEKINYLQISIANYEIREYSRAIMYLEDVIGQDKKKLCEHLPLLSKAYALFGDLDSVAGASSFQNTAPTMEDLLLSHQVSGQLEEVRIIFEKLGKDGLMTPAHMQEMIRCYLNLGEPYTAMNCIQSFTSQQPDLLSILSEGMTESLLKLGDFTQLAKFLENSDISCHADWFVKIGQIFVTLNSEDYDGVSTALSNIRTDVAKALRQTSLQFGDYQQGYSYLIKLQMLCEIERVTEVLKVSGKGNDFRLPLIEGLIANWDMACAVVQSDPNSLEPLLSLRRILLSVMRRKLPKEAETFLNNEIGKSWVRSAKIARKAGCYQQSYNFILNAEQYNIPSMFIEKAQLFWDKGDQDMCLFTLSRGIAEFFPGASDMKNWPAGERQEEREMCAKAKLLYAIYSEKTLNCDHQTTISNYQNAFDVCRQLEKSEAYLGLCLDRVVAHLDNNEQDQAKVCEMKILMVLHFGRSLVHGCKYIYQTVPRMLSTWLDMGEAQNSNDRNKATLKMNKLIERFLQDLPPFIFMTALPQLLSRLGHPNGKVFSILKTILATLVKTFPQQCLWAIQTVAKSSIQKRVKRYEELMQHPALRCPNLSRLIRDFTSLCDELNKLANFHLPHNMAFHALKISSVVRELPRLLASEKFSAIVLPITRFCSISLPRDIKSSTHEPFPKEAVYITGVEEEVTVLASLQMPRKITFRGSDGKLYDILCKPTDDLRRDGRLMEFNNIVNMYLHRDPESRARGLHIRTYVVIPLGESGGLLEWVPNLVGLRKLLIRLYKQCGKYTPTNELRQNECQVRDPLEKKRTFFVEKLLALHPPLFPEWFRTTFPDPSGWYLARQSYTRTTAVMSMVGYILGLGDRHGENVLFDCESGDTVHVDFNCLFNKGEKFDWKERVPFRLTHNMVAAMGPFGVEGTYRKSCEISLRVLRSQAKTLMSVLTPFAYDPFGSWGKNKEIVQNERDQKIGEACNELNDIEKRLNGSLRVKQKNNNLYLSVEGQARSLILEATDIDNLCQMYFGWGAYL